MCDLYMNLLSLHTAFTLMNNSSFILNPSAYYKKNMSINTNILKLVSVSISPYLLYNISITDECSDKFFNTDDITTKKKRNSKYIKVIHRASY